MSDARMGASLELNVTGVQQGAKQATTSLQAIQAEIIKTQEAIKTSTDPAAVDRLNVKLSNLQRNLKGLSGQGWDTATKSVNSLGASVEQVGTKTTQLSRIMNRNMHGVADLFIAPGRAALIFANDLPPLIQRFKEMKAEQAALRAEGKAAASTTKILAQAFDPLGLAVGLGAIALIHFIPKLIEYIKSSGDAATSTKTFSDAIEKATDYKNAIANVSKLTEDIKLAKDGFLDKNQVVKEYNDTIGKTTGKVNSLNEAESALVKNKDAYLQMMAQKAAANFAYQEAAKEAVKAQQDANNIGETPGIGEFFKSLINIGTGGDPMSKIIDNRLDDMTEAQKKAAQLNKIGDDFQKNAAEIAKKFGFNMGGDDPEKGTKPTIDALTELKNTFADIDRQASNHLIHLSDVAKLQLAAVRTAIDKITKGGGSAGPLADLKRHLETQLADKGIIKVKIPEIKPETPKLSKDAHILPVQDMTEQVNAELNQFLGSLTKSGITNFADAIGTAIGSGKGMEGIFDGFKTTLGQSIEDFGKYLIQQAVIFQAAKNAFLANLIENPVAAIAAGAALVALGAAIKASVKNGGGQNFTGTTSSGGSFSGNIGGGISSPSYSRPSASAPSGNLSTAIQNLAGGQVEFKLHGPDLVGSIKRTQQLQGI